jgi:cytoskeleton protein RodZ
MGSVSIDLKAEREKREISLAQIAQDTHISVHYLEALEEGRFSNLPGGMYNRAFLKAYCESLKLDLHDIMSRFEAENIPASERQHKPKSIAAGKNPSFKVSPIIIWTIMLLISASSIFFNRRWIKTTFAPYFSHESAAQATDPIKIKSAAKSPEPQNAQTVPPVNSPPTGSASVQPPAAASTPIPGDAQPPAVTTVQPSIAQAPQPDSPQAPGQTLRLEISALEKCWISVAPDSNTAYHKTLEPGETQSFHASEQFHLVLGNAGGIKLKINGQTAKPLGKSGEVVKLLINESNLPTLVGQTAS